MAEKYREIDFPTATVRSSLKQRTQFQIRGVIKDKRRSMCTGDFKFDKVLQWNIK